ncbi:MAG: succinate dehydrogenase/fumarate reductase iron-sulfur subunit [Actinomycetota bacterium]|nr:succinate dehydrogenase/fumarate reductase iron-sulfur subunit [Actinomycetota bacterium]
MNRTLRIWRGDRTGGRFVEYTVEQFDGEVLLDVVHRVQATVAPDLAVRWNCKAGKCGSCSAEVDGRPRLMCMTRMRLFPPDQPVTIAPLHTFPLQKDLVTDVSFNYRAAQKVPAFAPKERPGDGHRVDQVDVGRIQEFHRCIECFLCQDVCHVIRDHEENKAAFVGPRFMVRLAELEMHPLDTADRRAAAVELLGIGYCNITKCCTEVCPASIAITDNAIIPMKERVADRFFDPLGWLFRAIGRRR